MFKFHERVVIAEGNTRVPRCSKCGVDCVEVEVDFEYGDVILRKVKALRCPICKEEVFTPEQYGVIRARVRSVA
jgi:NAD-dependent SIR2 family protein deacetylase